MRASRGTRSAQKAVNIRFRRLLSWSLALLSAFCVGGCPLFADRAGCWDDRDCAPDFSCDRSSGLCREAGSTTALTCERPEDCNGNLNCGSEAVCVRGDCTFTGCVEGYECSGASGIWSCVRTSAGGAGGQAGEGGAAGGD